MADPALSEDLQELRVRLERRIRAPETGVIAEVHPILDSTNRRALELASDGAADGSVVVADRQTAGRGRRGRSWIADAGEGLLLSIVVRPERTGLAWGWLPLVAGVAVARAVRAALDLPDIGRMPRIDLKWPNDVRVGGRKVAGILAESRAAGVAVVGVGVNVNQTTFPDDLRDTATSLRLVADRSFDRARTALRLLDEWQRAYDDWRTGTGLSMGAYRGLLAGVGESVQARMFDGSEAIEGILEGVGDDGSLRIRTSAGVRTLLAGDVTLRST